MSGLDVQREVGRTTARQNIVPRVFIISYTLHPSQHQMFHNVVAIVSGGASGLGAATASYLVSHGARVVVADLPRAYESFLKLEDGSAGGGAASIKFASADVRNEDDVNMALDVAKEEFGEQGRMNILRLYLA